MKTQEAKIKQIKSHLIDLAVKERDIELKQLSAFFKVILFELSEGEALHLNSVYARINYISLTFKLDSLLVRTCHLFNKYSKVKPGDMTDLEVKKLGTYAILRLIEIKQPGIKLAKLIKELKPEIEKIIGRDNNDSLEFIAVFKVSIYKINVEREEIFARNIESGNSFSIKFNNKELSVRYFKNFKYLSKNVRLPWRVNLINCKRSESGIVVAEAMILEPDYLLDVSSISECFMGAGSYPLNYFLKRFLPRSSSKALLIGNIANEILDESYANNSLEFNELMSQLFKNQGLLLSTFSDQDVLDVVRQSKNIYNNIIADVNKLKVEHHEKLAYIEPSFISEDHGLQGRLDLFLIDNDLNHAEIIELKSGKPFKANSYGLNKNHYVQTLLYDLLIKHAFGPKVKPRNHIYYCKLSAARIKYAPVVSDLQFHALALRNDIVTMILSSLNFTDEEKHVLEYINPRYFEEVGGYVSQNAKTMHNAVKQLTSFELKYFRNYAGLIETEQYLSKVGGFDYSSGGLADLWNLNRLEKEPLFGIISDVKLINHYQDDRDSIAEFFMDERDSISNFRVGDIVVVYPVDREAAGPTRGQLLKGTILEFDQLSLKVRLRNKHDNIRAIKSYDYWNIEQDYLESSSNNIYKSLASFLFTSSNKRALWLGQRPPTKVENLNLISRQPKYLNTDQFELVNEMINSQEYYLLWGPPGTGKTSIMLKGLIDCLVQESDETIVVAAYTNRAVDEICANIETLEEEIRNTYVRIGSRYSSMQSNANYLLTNQIRDCKNRKEVLAKLKEKRIIVGTVSSLIGAHDFFSIKKIDRIIIDEASQILEPALIGLLFRAKRAILIGDHKQLPAVVRAKENRTSIQSEDLIELGFTNTRISLFERLYRQCQNNEWSYVVGNLESQGRMHQDICTYVSEAFYNNDLSIVKNNPQLSKRLTRPFDQVLEQIPALDGNVLSGRISFHHVDAKIEQSPLLTKICEAEADYVIQYLDQLLKNQGDSDYSIGVICPFKAQIALMRQKMESHFQEIPKSISIDTVERYQGSARDFIILSSCAQNQMTFDAIKSIDIDGDDRKLNVAITRAKEQFVFIGNERVLRTEKVYAGLLDYADLLSKSI